MPLQATSGAASYDAFGGGVVAEPNYIESCFSTYLYQADGSSAKTINNGIDLSGKGGLVWIKSRDTGSTSHNFIDTVRGSPNVLQSNLTSSQENRIDEFGSFLSTGFTLPYNTIYGETNYATRTYASWTFRKQPKFFDVVTYTGNSTARTIAHNLGSVPGCIIIKGTTGPASTQNWAVYHRSTGNTQALFLDLTQAPDVATNYWNDTTPTSTVFSLGAGASVNNNTTTYVAYLFAHDAGGFGLTGTDNVISCGSYTGTGAAGNNISLGYEAQWVLIKQTAGVFASVNNWQLVDVMRGMDLTANAMLNPNTSGAEGAFSPFVSPIATGFTLNTGGSATNGSGSTYIYIAIRRGPMKVPTVGTSVFSPVTYTGNGTTQTVASGNAPLDLVWIKGRSPDPENPRIYDRLRGATKSIDSTSTAAETTRADGLTAFTQNGFTVGSFGNENGSGSSIVSWNFKRAPSFFDVVCYTGTGSGQVINHNLGVTPELMIFKARNNLNNSGYEYWYTNAPNTTYALALNLNVGESYTKISSANSTTISLGGSNNYVLTGQTYVAYLFATCAGVSKVGSYTGTGNNDPGAMVSTGFAGGPRFILIKRTDATGNWWVFDTARGLVQYQPDKMLALNTTAAEVTSDEVDVYAGGFTVYSNNYGLNVSGGTYIYLAIA